MRYPILIILMLFTTIPLSAGPRTPLLMLVNGRNVDIELVASVESILMLEVDQGTRFTALLPQGDDAGMDCRTMACAIEMGQRHAVGHVLLTTLTGLGEKILIYYQLVDVTAAEVVLQDRITAAYIEDLDAVMRRVALSIVQEKSIDKTIEVGNVTAQESVVPRRRSARKVTGFTFGYLYPHNGYDDKDRSFTLEWRLANELDQFEVGTLIAARQGFSIGVFGNYLFSRKDTSPFIGAALGFHWVDHQYQLYYDDFGRYQGVAEKEHEDGFEITLNSGIKLFRTYNFQFMGNLGYTITLNDYDDRGLLLTIGILR